MVRVSRGYIPDRSRVKSIRKKRSSLRIRPFTVGSCPGAQHGQTAASARPGCRTARQTCESALQKSRWDTGGGCVQALNRGADSSPCVSRIRGGGSPRRAARGHEPVVPSLCPPLRRRHETGLNRYGVQLGPWSMQVDALFIAFEIAVPSVPAAIAKPAAIIASSRAYSAAAAPPSSRQKRVRKPTEPLILVLPLYPPAGYIGRSAYLTHGSAN